MPDKIKDAYSAVKSTGLFIDEADFRAQIAKDKKAVFELFNSEKSTKGLFIDEADFDAQLGLGKQPASPSGNGGASSSAQSTPPVTPSTPSGNPLKIGLYREEPTSQRVVPQQKQLNVGLEDFKEGTPKAPKVVSSKEAMKGIDVPKQTFKEAAKSMEDPTLEQAMTQKEWEEIKKNPTVVERIEGMANEFYEKEPARIQQDIYDRAADNFGAMSKTPMTEISAAYNNATKFNDESAKQYLQGLKKNLVGDYLTYLDKADPERSSDIKARISEIETKLGVPNVEEEKFLYDLEKEALQLKANYANREAKKAMYSMDYDAYSVDATMYEEKIKSLKAKRDKYVNPDGSPKNSLGNKYQEYNSQMGALNKEIEDISAEFSSYVGEDGVLKDESKRGYVEGLQQRATALEAQANDLQKNYSYLFENGKLKQTEEEKKALVIDNQLNQVIEQYNALGEKYGVSQDKLNVINNAATFNSQINGILTDGLKEYKGLYEAIKKGEEQTARGLEFTEESGEVKEAIAAGIIGTGQALETAGLNIKQLPKIVLGVVKKDLGIPFVDQTGMLDYLFTDWLDDAVNRQFEQNYEKLEYGENVEIPYFVKKAQLFGSGIGSLMSFMAGGEVLAITKIPRLMSLWGTAFVIQEGNNYQEALRNGLSPTEARLYSSAISGISATIELAVPDFRYLDGVVRASILQSIKKGASVQDAIKQGLKAMPQSLKAYSKHMLQEGAEEGAENIGVDVTKSILNYAEEKEIYKDLFKADALFDAITAGAMVGGAMTAISRPDQKSPTQQSLIGAISETTEEDVLQVSTIAPENAAVIAEIQGIGAGMRQLPSFTALSQTEKNFVISESFRKKQLQRAQKEAGVKDPNIQAEIDKIDSDVEAVFSGKKVGETYEVEAGADEKVTNVVGNELINENVVEQRDFTSQMLNPSLFEGVGIFSNELGGSGVNSVVSNHNIVNGIDVVEFSNPNTGVVDIVVSGVSGRDFVGFYRLYENGKPTNKWSSKFENQSRNKGNFKTMISEVQARLPEGHEYTEKTSISTDGLRVWEQQLSRGYDLQYDENGKLKTNRVAINGDAIVNELGIDVKAGDFDVIEVKNNQEFDIVRQALTPYMESLGLDSSNIYWRNGTVEVDLPILARGKKSNAAQTAEVTQEAPIVESEIAATPASVSDKKADIERRREEEHKKYKYDRTKPNPVDQKYDAELAALEQAQEAPIIESTQEGIKEGAVEEIVPEEVLSEITQGVEQMGGVQETPVDVKNNRKKINQDLISIVWKRLAKNGIDNADNLIGTRESIENEDFDKFWSNVTNEDLQELKSLYESKKQEELELFDKFNGEFDPSTGTFTSNDTTFFDDKIQAVESLLGQPQESVGEDVEVTVENNDVIKQNKIEGGFLDEQQSAELQKEIESKYNMDGPKFGPENEDIRTNIYNYDTPLAEKNVNGVNLRIAEGLLEKDKSGKKRSTYLLYADGKIAGKFYSVDDIKKVVKFIEDNLIKGIGEGKAIEQSQEGVGKETTQALETETKIESIVSEALSELNIVKEQTPAKKQKKESKTAARKRFREATLGFEPSDPDKAVETYIRQYFSGGGKVDTESLIRELGLRGRNRELRGKIGLHQKGKPSIERLSEIIHERLTEEQQEMIYQPDIRSIIIDILQSESKLDMRINLEEDYLAETEVDMMGMTPQQYQDYKRHERDAEAFYEEMQLEEAQKQEAYDELFSPEVIDALMDIDEMSIEEIETKYGDAIDADGNIDEVKLNELISNEQGTKNQEGTKENISKEGGRENQKPATEEVAILEVFDTIENAQRTKKTVKGKKEAMEEAVKEYGEVGEKAIFVESNFKDIIESLKEVKDAKGNNILKVKC